MTPCTACGRSPEACHAAAAHDPDGIGCCLSCTHPEEES